MKRDIELIGAAWGLGGADPGCAEAPAILIPQLSARLQKCGAKVATGAMLCPDPAERRRQLAISKLCRELAHMVTSARRAGRLPCVIGGDHTSAGGTWTGVARSLDGALGLIWVDAHMDSHTPGTSHSGRLHGMPLAWLLGQDDDPLYGLGAGVVAPSRVALVGVRSFEPEEQERLERLRVRVFHMDEVRSRGLKDVFREALAIAGEGTQGFGISIDLDAVTPEEAPGVACRVADGLNADELAQALKMVARRAELLAVELVEYLPRLDPDGRSARVAVDLLAAALCGPREDAQILPEALDRTQP